MLEEGLGDAGFFFQSGGGEQVGVLAFVLVFVKVAELDQAFFDQGAQAVVGLPRLTPNCAASWLRLRLASRCLSTCRRQASGGVRGAVFIFTVKIVRLQGSRGKCEPCPCEPCPMTHEPERGV